MLHATVVALPLVVDNFGGGCGGGDIAPLRILLVYAVRVD